MQPGEEFVILEFPERGLLAPSEVVESLQFFSRELVSWQIGSNHLELVLASGRIDAEPNQTEGNPVVMFRRNVLRKNHLLAALPEGRPFRKEVKGCRRGDAVEVFRRPDGLRLHPCQLRVHKDFTFSIWSVQFFPPIGGHAILCRTVLRPYHVVPTHPCQVREKVVAFIVPVADDDGRCWVREPPDHPSTGHQFIIISPFLDDAVDEGLRKDVVKSVEVYRMEILVVLVPFPQTVSVLT